MDKFYRNLCTIEPDIISESTLEVKHPSRKTIHHRKQTWTAFHISIFLYEIWLEGSELHTDDLQTKYWGALCM